MLRSMNRRLSTFVVLGISFALLLGLCSLASAQTNRYGRWYNQPEREKGNALFEREIEHWISAPVEKPMPPAPTPKPIEVAPPPVKPKPQPAPKMMAPTDIIYFDYDKSDLRPRSKQVLDQIADYLKANSSVNLTITGHCDNVASDNYNNPLSMSRSLSAMNYLKSKGIDPKRIGIAGKGKRAPVATNDTPEGRQLNRRCEFVFSE